jgi:predicted unusual protein kinase regulating ubiquinone biosynthesis (AarF/ABC1/UbiB family)
MKARKPASSSVPSSRFARLTRFGALASGVAGGMLAEGARQLVQGKRPRFRDLVLTPTNVSRVTDQLAQLRGAAMKLGQMLSMDAGDFLPAQLTQILSRLRSDGHHMPQGQLVKLLNQSWGKGWEQRLARFSYTPIAAASIGQVHSARTHDGIELAIKIQYPGVAASIASDVDNVVSLLRIAGLVPGHLNIAPLVEEAKRQLHQEADYVKESQHLTHYRHLLAGNDNYVLPEVLPEFTTKRILAMTYIPSEPIESAMGASQVQRDRIVCRLFELLFLEIFEFRRVQTDPNFANYRIDPISKKLVLLDFGATRIYTKPCVEAYRRLLTAGMNQDRNGVAEAACGIGYFQELVAEHIKAIVVDVFMEACEPLRQAGGYDFGTTDLARRIHNIALPLGLDRDAWHTPPVDAIFLHRKIGGLYLLAVKLNARVDLRKLFQPYASA